MTIVHNPKLISLSNMPLYQTYEKEGFKYDRFEKSVKMSTYLVAFFVGDFKFKETETDRGVKVRFLVLFLFDFVNFFCFFTCKAELKKKKEEEDRNTSMETRASIRRKARENSVFVDCPLNPPPIFQRCGWNPNKRIQFCFFF